MRNEDIMRVILWAPFGAGTHYWGPGTSAYRLYRLNKDPNVKITLVHGSNRQGDFPDVYDEQIKIGNIENVGFIGKIMFLIKSLVWIIKNHKNYVVLHGLGTFCDTFFPAFFFEKKGGRSFVKITGDRAGFSNNSKLSKITGISYFRRRTANDITGYISLSNVITESLLQAGIEANKVHQIPNGVDTHRFYPFDEVKKKNLRNELGLDDVYTFVFCGGLSHRKRVMETVKAAHILSLNGVNGFQLLIVGPDRSGVNLKAEMQKYIKENELAGLIYLIE